MLAIIENEIYKYSLQLKEYYDSSGHLTEYPQRKPLQCMVLKKFADSLFKEKIYSCEELQFLISEHITFESKENLIDALLSFGFIRRNKSENGYYLDADYEKHYLSFLGLN